MSHALPQNARFSTTSAIQNCAPPAKRKLTQAGAECCASTNCVSSHRARASSPAIVHNCVFRLFYTGDAPTRPRREKARTLTHEKESKAYQTGQPDLDADRSHAQLASPLQPDPYSVPSLRSSPQASFRFENTPHNVCFCFRTKPATNGLDGTSKTKSMIPPPLLVLVPRERFYGDASGSPCAVSIPRALEQAVFYLQFPRVLPPPNAVCHRGRHSSQPRPALAAHFW